MAVNLGLLDTQKEYKLRCKVLIKQKWVISEADGKRHDHKVALLIPEISSVRDRFLAAWLPETEGEHYEINIQIGHPIASPARAAIVRRNQDCEQHHIFVMSVGVEDELVKHASGMILDVTVLPEDADEETALRDAPDTDRDIKGF